MKGILSLITSIIALVACNDIPKAESRKELLIGGELVSPPSNADTTITIRTKDSIYVVSFHSKIETTKETAATVKATAFVDTVKRSSGDTTPKVRKNIRVYSGFEEANWMSPYNNPPQTTNRNGILQSGDFAKAGTRAIRFEVNKNDKDYGGSKRSELYAKISDPAEVENWSGASYLFNDGWDTQPCLIQQWHTSSPVGSPPCELRTNNGRLELQHCIDSRGGATSSSEYFAVKDLGAITFGKWMDVVIHYKERIDNTGLIEVWLNGVKKVSFTGQTSFKDKDNKPLSNYWKFGANKWPWAGESGRGQIVFYMDEVRYGSAGATYDDVKP